MRQEPRSVLAVRLRSIGDAVLLTPALQALKRHWPRARLTLVIERPIDAVLQGLPFLDELVVLPRRGVRATLARLRAALSLRGRFDLALDFHGGPTAANLVWASGAPRRVGLASYRSLRAYNERLDAPHKGSGRRFTQHTLDSNLAFLERLGIPVKPAPPLRVGLEPAAHQRASRALETCGVRPREAFVLVHPSAALESKRWPLVRFAEVAHLLASDGLTVVAGFPAREREACAAFRRETGLPVVTDLDLGAYAALIGAARLFVGNDSGPAHLAAAQAVAGIAVFGSQDPRVWRPVGPRQRALWSALPCSPCRGLSCDNPARHACLEAVPAAWVVETARRLLAAEET